MGPLATEGWIKAVWERASHYGYNISLDYPTERLPREGDGNLVTTFLERGKLGKELVSLNQCCISHQAKHLSCISTAEGNHLDPVYLSPPLTKEHLSFDRFAQEEPTKQNWLNLEWFWRTYCNRFLELATPLGDWLVPGHKI